MYQNSGYLDTPDAELTDRSRPLIVTACGCYQLLTRPVFNTIRPEGRQDYQLLYIPSGSAHFFFRGREEILPAGHMALYRPGEPQRYTYYAKDQPTVYWIHFTGSHVEELLGRYSFPEGSTAFASGTSPEYQRLFREIIRELQVGRPCFEELLSLHFLEILLLVKRQFLEAPSADSKTKKEMEQAAHFFNENFNTPISIEDYAASLHMTPCWFIRSFRQFTGMAPLQYITSIRIANAQTLLASSDYNISEIASIVGYENSLYFSRIFRKQTGMPPSQYRKQAMRRER